MLVLLGWKQEVFANQLLRAVPLRLEQFESHQDDAVSWTYHCVELIDYFEERGKPLHHGRPVQFGHAHHKESVFVCEADDGHLVLVKDSIHGEHIEAVMSFPIP